jgi:hypothetical protein
MKIQQASIGSFQQTQLPLKLFNSKISDFPTLPFAQFNGIPEMNPSIQS